MYNAYEQEPNGIASGKKYDYCEYRRGHESGEPKVKTDFLLPVLKVQIILCIAIGIFMLIMFKTQSSVFLFLRESYYNISSTDIPFAEVVKSIKKSADFVFEPINDTDKVKKSDETESYSQEASSLTSYDDNELTGIGGEDILTAKEKIICAGKHVSKSCNAGRKCKNHIKIRLSCKSCYGGIWLSHRTRFGGAGGYAYKSDLRRNRHKSTGI